MDWSRLWQPRNEQFAGKVGGAFVCATSVISMVFTPLTSAGAPASALVLVYVVLALLIMVGLLLVRFPHRAPRATWLVLPNIGLVIIAALNIATRDVSVGSQVFLLFPVVYASSQLRAPAAYLTACTAAACEACTVFVLEPPSRALTDFFYLIATLACFTVLQATAVARQDALVGQLRRLADIDPLTGLTTRRAVVAATRAAMSPGPNAGTAVVFLDVDHFKAINDTYGHLVGDAVLVHLADILRSSVRATDTAGRLGGDELVVLLPNCSADHALARAEDILQKVRQNSYQATGETELPLSVSVGVAHVPGDFRGDPDQLYALADEALYDAKRAGRGRIGVGVRTPEPAGQGPVGRRVSAAST